MCSGMRNSQIFVLWLATVVEGSSEVGSTLDYDYEEGTLDSWNSFEITRDFARLLQSGGQGEGEGEGEEESSGASSAQMSFNLVLAVNKPPEELQQDQVFMQKLKETGSMILFQTPTKSDQVQVVLSEASVRRLSEDAGTIQNVVAQYTTILTAEEASELSLTRQTDTAKILAFINDAFGETSYDVHVSEETIKAMTTEIDAGVQQLAEEQGFTLSPTASPANPTTLPTPPPTTPSPSSKAPAPPQPQTLAPPTPTPPSNPSPAPTLPPLSEPAPSTPSPQTTPSPTSAPSTPSPPPPPPSTSVPTSSPTATPSPPFLTSTTAPTQPTIGDDDEDELVSGAQGVSLAWVASVAAALFVLA